MIKQAGGSPKKKTILWMVFFNPAKSFTNGDILLCFDYSMDVVTIFGKGFHHGLEQTG